ncbi:MAG: insulinase family protein [Muribaculaceae bacterium]|nr:insulinase family protein [Muribaculaceae bacterium]
MKKFFKCAVMALAALAFSEASSAQQMPAQLPQVPMDSAVITGTLPNGLTYYIRHNAYPKGQADFYIAQKVGSVLEEDNQRGLAHFLEHMCFNGTKNFPGNSLVSWLESVGVKFGAHLNAYTATDETVYNITNVPTNRTQTVDSCLLILHDWANELLLEPEEIDKERGVIHEEWRSRSNGTQRILEDLLPTIYPGSRYAERMPIGTMEVVDNFPYQALRDYYEKWYRPDLQGIIVVGDIDAERTEQKIKEMFADIEMPENAAERTVFDVPDTPGTIYAIGSDKEQQNALLYLLWKFDTMPREMRSSIPAVAMDYAKEMISAMLNQRLSDMMSQPETPFAVGQATIGNFLFSNTKDMFAMLGIAKEGDLRPTLQALYREVLRAKAGFNQSELDRAKQEYLSGLEKLYNNRNSQETGSLTSKYVRHFLDNTPAADISVTYPLMKEIAENPMFGVETINAIFNEITGKDNRVVIAFMPEAEGYLIPTQEQLAEAMAAVDGEEIQAFVDQTRTDPLIPQLPAPGKIVKTETDNLWNATVWTLSNGVKVMIKSTGFKDDEILFNAVAPQGMSRDTGLASVADFVAFDEMSSRYAIGAYNNTDLTKLMTGKQVSLNPSFNLYSRSISGSTTPKDLATQMEMIYGYFTSVNYDAQEFAATKNIYENLLRNQEASPQYQFGKDLRQALYSSPYMQTISTQTLTECTREGIETLVKAQVANAADYTFIFVGNIDPETFRPLAEQYLATLPANAKKVSKPVKKVDPAFETVGGEGTDTFTFPMTNPQTQCAIIESASVPVNALNYYLADITGQILSARLIKTVREEMAAVYSIFANGGMSSINGRNVTIESVFPMNPDKKTEVLAVIRDEFGKMAQKITDEELSKVKEYLVKSLTEGQERNQAWRSAMSRWTTSGGTIDTFNGAVDLVNSISAEQVQNFVKSVNAQGNYRVVILDPEQ